MDKKGNIEMTSLKEEIEDVLDRLIFAQENKINSVNEGTNKILQLIEKRLDEHFKQREQKINDKTDFDHGYLQGLYDAKMEMLDDT
jgi:hypothetical protein